MDRDQRSETLAEYFAKVQWPVRPVTCAIRHEPVGDPPPVDEGSFSTGAIVRAGKQLCLDRAGVAANLGKTRVYNRAGGPAPTGIAELGEAVWTGSAPEAARGFLALGTPIGHPSLRCVAHRRAPQGGGPAAAGAPPAARLAMCVAHPCHVCRAACRTLAAHPTSRPLGVVRTRPRRRSLAVPA